MREPEKFSVLLALGYAACFGWGIERWANSFAPGRRILGVVAAMGSVIVSPSPARRRRLPPRVGQVAVSVMAGRFARGPLPPGAVGCDSRLRREGAQALLEERNK